MHASVPSAQAMLSLEERRAADKAARKAKREARKREQAQAASAAGAGGAALSPALLPAAETAPGRPRPHTRPGGSLALVPGAVVAMAADAAGRTWRRSVRRHPV